MKKVAIFSDVDGTIYPFPSGILSKKNKDKVNEIVDRGVEFIINTLAILYDKIKNLANNLKARYHHLF
ncbi:hypothetical protein [Mycoplasmopsis cynos]|uniref:hypothetical protein n=1 Tax=Mycoplasmopsis cynos TaxID=171284 RepID=UPI00220E49A0|nr:hypothetical protein [Mycoplasmopsis cynos]UWV77217.1 hypothetical protein NW070_05880 [Mycoplasmopsis cynos]